MPQRTNQFQELVHLVELAFAGPGDKVTASVMETGQGLETEREIDIRRETSNGLYKIKVAVEAKDEGRPWEVTKVEQYLGKYRGEGRVLVDKIVLVSRHGFTGGAIEKARAADVVLLTLDEAKDFDWNNLDTQYGPLKKESTLHVRIAPHVCKIIFDPPIQGDADGKAAKEGRLVCVHSTDHGTPFEFARRAIFEKNHPPTIDKLKEMESLAVGQPNGATMHAGFDMSHYQLRYRDTEHPLKRMTVIVHAVDATALAECKAYELGTPEGKKIIHHMSATLGEKHFQWVMPQEENMIAGGATQPPISPPTVPGSGSRRRVSFRIDRLPQAYRHSCTKSLTSCSG